ncbi:MAG: cyclopropane-fatty-acyl-phospholipid synthase family protein [Anaerolineae bacterium]
MDKWKYFDITHQHHVCLNPMLPEKFDRFIQLLQLESGKSVLDIACGNGEFLLSLAKAYQISGTGIDLSPYFIAKAQASKLDRLPEADLKFIELDGAEFKPEKPHSFHLAACIGASWIFGGHAGTLDALIELVEPGGWVIVGEPFWLQTPADDYLEASEISRNEFGTHYQNVKVAEEKGLNLVHTFMSTLDEWDMYEGLKWLATDEYARTHPDDPDLPEILDKVAVEKEIYLKWGRDSMGWAIYLFRKPFTA